MITLIKKVAAHTRALAKSAVKDLKLPRARSAHWGAIQKAHLAAHPACVACGIREQVQVHHIMPFHLHPELELEPTNLISLCMHLDSDCHLWVGHGDDFTAFVPTVVLLAHEVHTATVHKNPAKILDIKKVAKATRRFEKL